MAAQVKKVSVTDVTSEDKKSRESRIIEIKKPAIRIVHLQHMHASRQATYRTYRIRILMRGYHDGSHCDVCIIKRCIIATKFYVQ